MFENEITIWKKGLEVLQELGGTTGPNVPVLCRSYADHSYDWQSEVARI